MITIFKKKVKIQLIYSNWDGKLFLFIFIHLKQLLTRILVKKTNFLSQNSDNFVFRSYNFKKQVALRSTWNKFLFSKFGFSYNDFRLSRELNYTLEILLTYLLRAFPFWNRNVRGFLKLCCFLGVISIELRVNFLFKGDSKSNLIQLPTDPKN